MTAYISTVSAWFDWSCFDCCVVCQSEIEHYDWYNPLKEHLTIHLIWIIPDIDTHRAGYNSSMETKKLLSKMPRRRQQRGGHGGHQTHYMTAEKRALIVGYLSRGGSTTRETATRFGISPGTVSKLMAKHRRFGSLENRAKSGRPQITTRAQDNTIRRMVQRDRKVTGNLFSHDFNPFIHYQILLCFKKKKYCFCVYILVIL